MKNIQEIDKMIKIAGLEEPSDSFNQNVMDRIALEHIVKPVQQKSLFIKIYSLLFLAASVTIMLLATPQSSGNKLSGMDKLILNINSFVNEYQNFLIYLPIIIISSFILLLLDKLIHSNLVSNNHLEKKI